MLFYLLVWFADLLLQRHSLLVVVCSLRDFAQLCNSQFKNLADLPSLTRVPAFGKITQLVATTGKFFSLSELESIGFDFSNNRVTKQFLEWLQQPHLNHSNFAVEVRLSQLENKVKKLEAEKADLVKTVADLRAVQKGKRKRPNSTETAGQQKRQAVGVEANVATHSTTPAHLPVSQHTTPIVSLDPTTTQMAIIASPTPSTTPPPHTPPGTLYWMYRNANTI